MISLKIKKRKAKCRKKAIHCACASNEEESGQIACEAVSQPRFLAWYAMYSATVWERYGNRFERLKFLKGVFTY